MNSPGSAAALETGSITLVDVGIGIAVVAGLAYGFRKVYEGIVGKNS